MIHTTTVLENERAQFQQLHTEGSVLKIYRRMNQGQMYVLLVKGRFTASVWGDKGKAEWDSIQCCYRVRIYNGEIVPSALFADRIVWNEVMWGEVAK